MVAPVLGGKLARQDVQEMESKYYTVHISARTDLKDRNEEAFREAALDPDCFEVKPDAEVSAKVVVSVGNEEDATEDGLLVYSQEAVTLDPLAKPGARGTVEAHVELWRRCAEGMMPCLIIEDGLKTWPRLAQITAHLVGTIERVVADVEERNVLLFLGGTVEPADLTAQWLPTDMAHSAPRGDKIVLREATFVSGSFCYVVWPLAARRLLANLPLSTPVPEYLGTQLKAGRVRAMIVQPVTLAVQSLDRYHANSLSVQ